jgi:hypothetical protein
MRSDPKLPPIPFPMFNHVRDSDARNTRANINKASSKPSRCDQLLRRFSWQTDEDK